VDPSAQEQADGGHKGAEQDAASGMRGRKPDRNKVILEEKAVVKQFRVWERSKGQIFGAIGEESSVGICRAGGAMENKGTTACNRKRKKFPGYLCLRLVEKYRKPQRNYRGRTVRVVLRDGNRSIRERASQQSTPDCIGLAEGDLDVTDPVLTTAAKPTSIIGWREVGTNDRPNGEAERRSEGASGDNQPRSICRSLLVRNTIIVPYLLLTTKYLSGYTVTWWVWLPSD
jgi:hypothetical protein